MPLNKAALTCQQDEQHVKPTGDGDRAGTHDKFELDLLGFAERETKIDIGEVFLAQSERSNRMALFFIAEIGRVNLDHITLA